MFGDVSFAYPYILFLLVLIPVISVWYIFRYVKTSADVTFSTLKIFDGVKPTLRERLRHLPFILRMSALALLIIALARPQTFSTGQNIYTEGIDITMVLDISSSMLAQDFKPNRLEAAKNVIGNFVQERTSDRIGLVVFAAQSFTQCPLTIDYNVLRNLLGKIESGMITDGTAIGNAIANGVNRLKDSDSKSKIMILLTDGENNAGEIDPVTAAEIAAQFGIRVYTVGVGTRGTAPYPFKGPFGTTIRQVEVNIDEELLTKIAEMTDGRYFRATGNQKLVEIYNEIDQLEKTRVEVTSYRNAEELFYNWLFAGTALLLLEILLSRTYLRRLP